MYTINYKEITKNVFKNRIIESGWSFLQASLHLSVLPRARMAVLNGKSALDMIKEFRRNWHTFCNSERTTVCGADSMLLALQLSMAENNKQVSRLYLG